MAGYLTSDARFYPFNEPEVDRDAVNRVWTAEDHRVEARRLLAVATANDAGRLTAAQVHATLALSLETARAAQAEVRPHTHGPVR